MGATQAAWENTSALAGVQGFVFAFSMRAGVHQAPHPIAARQDPGNGRQVGSLDLSDKARLLPMNRQGRRPPLPSPLLPRRRGRRPPYRAVLGCNARKKFGGVSPPSDGGEGENQSLMQLCKAQFPPFWSWALSTWSSSLFIPARSAS